MAEELKPDICVVGGGPGGIAAALAAVDGEARVVLVEKAATGGANLATGTIPSKALIAAAQTYEALRAGPAMGVTAAPLQVNLARVRDHLIAVWEAIGPRVSAERLTALGVTVIAGEARFADRATLMVGDRIIRPGAFILAVGSVPAIPAIAGLDGVEFTTVADGIDLARKPAHLLILGAGSHALELAQAYTRLGIDATAVDTAPALPDEDPELAAIVVDRLRAEGIRVRAGVSVTSIARRRGGIRMTVDDPTEGEVSIDGSHLLVVHGRVPDVASLGLAAAGIAADWNGIVVNGNLRTANRLVYAIGDAVAGPASAVRAEAEGRRVVRSIISRVSLGGAPDAVPFVTFTDPALARVGLTEAEARRHHKDVAIHRYPFVDNDRALIERSPAGMIKVVTAGNGRILGATIVGRGADEMIALWSLAIANHLPLSAMASLPAPYPSRADISRRVAAGADDARLTSNVAGRIIGLLRKLG